MTTARPIPLYAKLALIFICGFGFIFVLHIGQTIIVPIIFATILAIALNPLVNFLMRKGMNKIVAIFLVVTFVILAIIGTIYIISVQIAAFSETYPDVLAKLRKVNSRFAGWIAETFSMPITRVNSWLKDTREELVRNLALGERLYEAGEIIFISLLLPVYLFLILFYKQLLLGFLRKLFQSSHHQLLEEMLVKSRQIIQSYLVGLFLEMLIVATLNSAGLLLLGIDYAILLGIIGAILNVIPYIGGIVGISLPIIMAFVTKETLTYPILVLVIYLFIQFVDNNYIVPKIVASRVRINALISVIVVLVGGAIWGVAGMFLSIPMTAIAKVIFDNVEQLKPWGFLLGNIVPSKTRFPFGQPR